MAPKLPTHLHGTVRKYKGDGRKLGYPTANISSPTTLADGVYFGHADLADYRNHPALIFIGAPVTMGETLRRVEAHLLGIEDADYYGHELTLSIEHFHRQNKHFPSVEALLQVMKADETAARHYFAE